MRPADVRQDDAQIWHVPMERLYAWAREHPDELPREYEYVKGAPSRADSFAAIWRDVWYVRTYVSGGILDDNVALATYFRVSLRDLRNAPRAARRLYVEAEWELCIEVHGSDPPAVSGEKLHTVPAVPPILVYQFHGLPEKRVMHAADVLHMDGKHLPVSFAIFGVELAIHAMRPAEEMYAPLSKQVNAMRAMIGLDPIPISIGRIDGVDGLLLTLEDGKPVTFST